MKRLFTFTIALLLIASSAFSQIATNAVVTEVPVDSGRVVLTRAQATAVVRDIIRLDRANELVKLMEGNFIYYLQLIGQKDSTIQSLQANEVRYQTMITNANAINSGWQKQYDSLQREYKRSVRAGRLKTVLIGAAIGFITYQFIH